jgi:hypothetical protein
MAKEITVMYKKHFIYAIIIAIVPALFMIPRSVNHLLAQNTTTQGSCMPVYYGSGATPGTTYSQQQYYSQPLTSIYPVTNTPTGTSTSTPGQSGIDDPNYAQKEFDAYYASKYPNYRQHEINPSQTTPYTPQQGYGYLTNNPSSIDDPNFAQKEFDSFYAQKYPGYYQRASSVPALRTQPTTPFPYAYSR